MPFIRYTRDKRGYDTTFVMHGYRPAHGPQRNRVLYLFRTPSHLRMGRRPLDEESREALEHTHPDLSFDWIVLGRDSEQARAEAVRDRDRERDGPRRDRRSPAPGRPPRPAAPPTPVVADDQSLLGRVVGAETAARYRARYTDLLQRIARRSRTPEERDRLTELAQRLNPDDWPEAEAVRAHVATIEQEWDAVAAELPARRRGRRGGRRREGGAEASAIMDGDGEGDDAQHDPGAARSDDGGSRDGGADPVWTDPGGPVGDDVPGDD